MGTKAKQPRDADTMIGRWILDQYHVIRVLGSGGMSCLYLAEQSAMDRCAAIKILSPEISKNERLRSRFRQEARAASRLAHPNIVTVYNFGELADGSLFLAMEYIDGASLASLIAHQRIPLHLALDIARQCAAALEHAHSKQVVHRDFKPENVMVARAAHGDSYQVKVVDFGIARFAEATANLNITQAGELIGTPRYLSPEQCAGAQATAHSDQYSFGLVLYELLCGRSAFEADSTLEYLRLHQQELPKPPSFAAGEELTTYDALVMRMLAKDPAERFIEMRDVREEVERASGEVRRVAGVETQSLALPSDGGDPTAQINKPSRPGVAGDVRRIALVGTRSPLSDLDYQNLSDGAFFHVPVRLTRYATPEELAETAQPPALSIIGLDGRRWREEWAASRWQDLAPAIVYVDGNTTDEPLEEAAQLFPHVLIGARPVDPVVLSVASGYVLSNERGGIGRLFSGHPMQTLQVATLAEKSPAVDALLDAAREGGVRRRVLHALAEVAEEMVMNVILHAEGQRGASTDARLPPGKEATVSWVISERMVAVSVQDVFGSLEPAAVLSRVTNPNAPVDLQRETVGAGMGLRIMAQAVKHLVFAICPGAWAEVLALIEREPAASGGRTLSVLRLPGEALVPLGNRLSMTSRREGERMLVQLKGEINETSELFPVFRHTGALHLDLQHVERINSIGLRNLVDAARGAPAAVEIHLERCSEAWVRQMSMIPALAEVGQIDSVLAPYFCSSCDREALEEITADELQLPLPRPRRCTCGQRMAFDAHPREYFAFYPDAVITEE